MHLTSLLALALALFPGSYFAQLKTKETTAVNVKKITPVLYVEEIEPCMKFWMERLGFEKTAEVPDGEKLGFVLLQKGNVEIMYQTFASQKKDAAAVSADVAGSRAFLYVEVDKLDAVIEAMKGAKIVVPVRTTFYGAKEIGVKDPGGHVILFAEFAAAAQH
jgi:uncharacterized glyoxalase superfamily protein PhnB